MRLLITGIAGFIGAHLAKAARSAGHSVCGIDRFAQPDENNRRLVHLRRARVQALAQGADIIDADIGDTAVLQRIFTRFSPHCIVHLAALPGVRFSVRYPFATAQANIMGSLSVFEAARHAPELRHFAYASSSSVYGDTSATISPCSLYAASKVSLEAIAAAYAHQYGFRATGMRFFSVYGSWGRPDMAYWLFTRALYAQEKLTLYGEGKLLRDFTHISDIVAGILLILGSAAPRGHRLYDIGYGEPRSVARLLEILQECTQQRARIVSAPAPRADARMTHARIDAMRRDFGYAPQRRLEEGMAAFVRWYAAQGKVIDCKAEGAGTC